MRSRFVIPPERPLPPPQHDFESRAAAWNFLRYLLDCIAALFGAPAEIAGHGVVSPAFRADMFFWLRPAEKLARLLLLAEAAEIAPEPERARKAKPVTKRIRVRDDLNNPDSATWRVTFNALPQRAARGSGARGWQVPCLSPWQLAARFEAVTRVLMNPAPYARRLARRLRRKPSPAVRRLFTQTLRVDAEPLLRAVLGAIPLARRARLIFDTT